MPYLILLSSFSVSILAELFMINYKEKTCTGKKIMVSLLTIILCCVSGNAFSICKFIKNTHLSVNPNTIIPKDSIDFTHKETSGIYITGGAFVFDRNNIVSGTIKEVKIKTKKHQQPLSGKMLARMPFKEKILKKKRKPGKIGIICYNQETRHKSAFTSIRIKNVLPLQEYHFKTKSVLQVSFHIKELIAPENSSFIKKNKIWVPCSLSDVHITRPPPAILKTHFL